ncbi:MAG: hypothetical protein CSA20_03500 [Deltaproteobacteria bacterium]|nr:MAG: hypothetical protein CSB23_02510 [Deltaproteobacteria bacterium]PIE73166.1 MAG: hypothetical protein CSA20_03500 [Deltaproteobacteria bacterium]
MQAVGILFPPILQAQEDGSFCIISGQRRIHFAVDQSRKKLVCGIVPRQADHNLILEIILREQNQTKGVSLAEKARFLEIASKYNNRTALPSLYFKRLDIKQNPSFITPLLQLLDQGDFFIQQADSGFLSEQILSELMRISRSERTELLHLFTDLQLGTGKQKRLFNMLRDAAYRANISISDYLQSEEIQVITQDSQNNGPQRFKRLDALLLRQLSPGSIAAQDRFKERIQALRLPPNQNIIHSQAFEEDAVTFTMTFASFEECVEFIKKTDR